MKKPNSNNGQGDENGEETDIEDLLSDVSTLKEEHEELDKTEVLVQMAKLLSNTKQAEVIEKVHKNSTDLANEMAAKAGAGEVGQKSLDLFIKLTEFYSSEEDNKLGKRMNDLLGFGRTKEDEAAKFASKHVSELLSEVDRFREGERKEIRSLRKDLEKLSELMVENLEKGKEKEEFLDLIEIIKSQL